jgi:hypothetical protein
VRARVQLSAYGFDTLTQDAVSVREERANGNLACGERLTRQFQTPPHVWFVSHLGRFLTHMLSVDGGEAFRSLQINHPTHTVLMVTATASATLFDPGGSDVEPLTTRKVHSETSM